MEMVMDKLGSLKFYLAPKINEEESKVVGPGAANAAKRAAYEQLKKTLAENYQIEVEGERKSGEDRQTALKNLSEYQSKIQTIAEAEKIMYDGILGISREQHNGPQNKEK
jgi:ribosomal protein S11